MYSLQFNENVKIRLQMSLKQQRRQSKTKSLILFQHNNVTTMRPFARSLRTTTLLTNNSQHCWMSCCVRLHNLLHVVAQSLKQAKLLATCKRSCWLTMTHIFHIFPFMSFLPSGILRTYNGLLSRLLCPS